MKFLLHSLNFAPELTGIGKYTGEMVHWLVQRGHDVRVVTAPRTIPNGKCRMATAAPDTARSVGRSTTARRLSGERLCGYRRSRAEPNELSI